MHAFKEASASQTDLPHGGGVGLRRDAESCEIPGGHGKKNAIGRLFAAARTALFYGATATLLALGPQHKDVSTKIAGWHSLNVEGHIVFITPNWAGFVAMSDTNSPKPNVTAVQEVDILIVQSLV